jgi:hypothetical protein
VAILRVYRVIRVSKRGKARENIRLLELVSEVKHVVIMTDYKIARIRLKSKKNRQLLNKKGEKYEE